MKRTLGILFFIFILLTSSLGAAYASDAPRLGVLVDALNVRQGPGTNYTIINAVHLGDQVTAIGQNSAAGWYQVQLDDGSTGWIKGVYVQAVSGDPTTLPEVVTAAPASAASPAGSRSGSTMVFQTSSGAIYVVNPDGSGLRFLTNGIDPALSPDGQTVAFTRWTDGHTGSVWLINTDGSNERDILDNVTQPKSPSWSPDGKQIVINMQNGGTQQDTILPRCRAYKSGDPIPPRFKQVGGQICAFIPADPWWGLRLINLADGSFKDLPRDTHSFAPAWDPANTWHVVYHGDHGLVSLDVNQQTTSPLTNNVDDRAPVFSPDGSKIALTFRQNDHWEIHVMNADGTNEVRLTETPLTVIVDAQIKGQPVPVWNNASPAWSPDGSQIAFVSDRSGQWEIWAMNADGSNQHVLIPASALGGASIHYNGVDERVISWR